MRKWVPVLGLGAIVALLFRLPHVPQLFGAAGCPTCQLPAPYLAMIGVAYLAALAGAASLFPRFPSRQVALCGLLWALALGGTLTYRAETICTACLVAHSLHFAMWLGWIIFPSRVAQQEDPLGGIKAVSVACLSIAALAGYGALSSNLRIYGIPRPLTPDRLVANSAAPQFDFISLNGEKVTSTHLPKLKGMVLNFVSPTCRYSAMQLPYVDRLREKYEKAGIQFVNVAETMSGPMITVKDAQSSIGEIAKGTELVVDPTNSFGKLFDVRAFPTLVILEPSGRVSTVIKGADPNLTESVSALLEKLIGI